MHSSNKYAVDYTDKADKALRKMDAFDRKTVLAWIDNKLQACSDPRRFGKGLKGERSEEWSYRIGDFRVIADIQDDRVLILIVDVGHRKKIYN